MATTMQQVPAALPTRETIETAIELIEGPYHVSRIYYANLEDAAIQRRHAAERLRRDLARGISDSHRALCLEVQRITAAGASTCAWCGRPFAETDAVTPLGGRLVHDRPCSDEFDAFTDDGRI